MPQDTPRNDIRIAPPLEADLADWRVLYDGYARFYRVPMSDETADLVWGWLQDPDHEECGLLARDADGKALGLAHLRPFSRPLRGRVDGFLDDLFVTPEARGSGVLEALWSAIRVLAGERGWSTVRWLTAEDNYRARAAYDRVATRTAWLTYDMDVTPPKA